MPLVRALGLTCSTLAADEVTLVMGEVPIAPNPNGAVNGGLVVTAADQAFGILAVRQSASTYCPAATLHMLFHSPALVLLRFAGRMLLGGRNACYLEVVVSDGTNFRAPLGRAPRSPPALGALSSPDRHGLTTLWPGILCTMRRDEQILQAACQLFYERGFDASGIDAIGARAGVSGPAIYRYFSSKQEILATLFDQTHDTLLQTVGGTFSEPQDELEHLLRAHLKFVSEHPELAAVYHRETNALVEPYRARWRRRETRYVARWTDCLQRCYPEADPDEAVTATWALMHLLDSVPEWPAEARRVPDLIGFVTEVALAGLERLGTVPATARLEAG